jgi:hypothetical protein
MGLIQKTDIKNGDFRRDTKFDEVSGHNEELRLRIKQLMHEE